MFSILLDTVVIGVLMGIMISILLEKNLFPIKKSALLGLIGAIVSFLLFEMFSINPSIIQIGLGSLIFIFGTNIAGKFDINLFRKDSYKTIDKLEKVERSK